MTMAADGPARYPHLERALIACAKLSLRVAELDESLRRDAEAMAAAVRDVMDVITKAQSYRFGVAVDPLHAGYMVVGVDGTSLRVPYHLYEVMPDGELLAELVSFARRIRSQETSTMSISGSTAMYEGFGAISDVDLCEYVDRGDSRRSLHAAVEHAEGIDSLSLIFFCARVEQQERRKPWDVPPSQDPEFQSLLEGARKAKLNFLANLQSEGLVVMTNLVFAAESANDPVLGATHYAQEIALTSSGSWLPRDLSDPLDIGRYVLFLVNDIEVNLRKSLNKAAKRAYALARLLTRDDDADTISESLRANDVFLIAALESRLAIARAIDALEDSALRNQLLPLIVSTLQLLCNRGVDPVLRAIAENGKQLDDFSGWIDNLVQYMQNKNALGMPVKAFLRDFGEDVQNRITVGA
jgi:hypothetical protein